MAAALEIPILDRFDSAHAFATEIPPPAHSIDVKGPGMGPDTEAPDARRLEMESYDLGTEVAVDPASDCPSSYISPPAVSIAIEQVHSSPPQKRTTQTDLIPLDQLPASPAVISLLNDSGSDSDIIITHATSRAAESSSYSSPYYYYSSSSENEPSRKRTPQHGSFPPPKRRRESKTGPWSYRDRMRFVGALQRGTDLIALARSMHRDVDDVFEKFSDVVAAGLYQCGMRDQATQTDAEGEQSA